MSFKTITNPQQNNRTKEQNSLSLSNHSNSESTINNNSSNQTKSPRTSPRSTPNKNDRLSPKSSPKSDNTVKLNVSNKIQNSKNENTNSTDLNEDDTTQELSDNQDSNLTFNLSTNNHDHNDTNSNQQNDKQDKPNNKQTVKDSPAFRLRTRRSTPRKLDSIYSSPYSSTSRKSSLYSPNNSDQLQAKVAKLKSGGTINDVKRNLFDSNKKIKTDHQLIKNRNRSHSPSRSLVEDVDLNVFAENVPVEKLGEIGKNNLNYLCLRIIEVLNEEYLTVCSPDCSNQNNSMNLSNDQPASNKYNSSPSVIKCSNCPKQRLLKIYCQQAETKSSLNVQKPVIILQLFNEYCNFKDRFVNGKILEIVKFEVKKLAEHVNYRHNSIDIPVYPFYIEVKANKDNHWVSLISIKKKYEPTNSNLLNVINTQNKQHLHENIEDQPPTKNAKVVFSSYVVKSESTNDQPNSNHLKNTNSPTIRRFMKTINKTYAQDTNSKQLKLNNKTIKKEKA